LVFFLGLVGTIGTFLFAAAEGRGSGTIFYGAIIWGLGQIILGFVLAIRAQKQRRVGDEEDEEDRPSRRRKSARKTPQLPTPVLVGCGVAGGLLLLGLAGLAVVMILIQSLQKPDQDTAKGKPPPPNTEVPVAEDLGPKEAQTPIAGATPDPTFKDQA